MFIQDDSGMRRSFSSGGSGVGSPGSPSSPDALITQAEFDTMFSIVRTIIKIVREHVPLMETAASRSGQMIGGIFIKMCPWLKHYAVYINSFDASANAVSVCIFSHSYFPCCIVCSFSFSLFVLYWDWNFTFSLTIFLCVSN